MLADPWVWFYYFWIPEYLTRSAGFTAADVGKYAWIPFLAQGVGIVLGGMLSDVLLRRGVRAVQARLAIMLIGMLLMTPGILAAFELDIVIIFAGISSAMFGFGFWAPNMMSLCADAFPRTAVGSVVGLSGMGAGVGGMLFTMADRLDARSLRLSAGVHRSGCDSAAGVRGAVCDAGAREGPEDSLAKIAKIAKEEKAF